MPSVAYASFCCPKDMERAHANFKAHLLSHWHHFDEVFFIHQRCMGPSFASQIVDARTPVYFQPTILEGDYPRILRDFGIQYPCYELDQLTHGWDAPHFYAHHLVNHLLALRIADSDYIAFADADCYIKDTPEGGPSWVEMGIHILESDPRTFVVSPSDGGPARNDSMMSQQVFLVNRKRMQGMEFIPWDGTFIEGGPFQEFYGLLEGFIYRHMKKHGLYRTVLPATWRWWHKEWH